MLEPDLPGKELFSRDSVVLVLRILKFSGDLIDQLRAESFVGIKKQYPICRGLCNRKRTGRFNIPRIRERLDRHSKALDGADGCVGALSIDDDDRISQEPCILDALRDHRCLVECLYDDGDLVVFFHSHDGYNCTMIAYLIFGALLCCLSLYSFVLVDPNITFVNHPLWTSFRETMVQIGYHDRPLSWYLYLSIIVALTGFHLWAIRNGKKLNPLRLALIAGAVLVGSYPFLSHDFFNYMFDAKILTVYGDNPYLMRALDYPEDPWLRFMHWTHRTYPYGPFFLVVTLVPSFLSMGTFVIGFILMKLLFVGCFVAAVWALTRIKPIYGIFFATQPYILIEGLVAAHNDLIGVALAILGVSLLLTKDTVRHKMWAGVLLVLSALIKYMTAPFVILTKENRFQQQWIALAGVIALIGYLTVTTDFQQWYVLNLLVLLPFLPRIIMALQPLYLGLLLSYYPFIRLGGWGDEWHVQLKLWIVAVSVILTIAYLVYLQVVRRYDLREREV